MSLFSWLFRSKTPVKPLAESSGLSRMEATRPVSRGGASKGPEGGNAQAANRKGERMARRELLYTVVRDSMMRAGVLSASYKFKVLSLDARGRQFLVMVDLAQERSGNTARLAEIEALIAQAAKSRHDILVTAVYWRVNEHVAVGDPNAQAKQKAPPPPPVDRSVPPGVDPIEADEVAAFNQALASGATASLAAEPQKKTAAKPAGAAPPTDGGARRPAPSYTLLTGFEDTELPESNAGTQDLSGTQYGSLK